MMLLNVRKESLTASPSPTTARAASLTSWRALTTSSHSIECQDADEPASHEGEPSGGTGSETGAAEGPGRAGLSFVRTVTVMVDRSCIVTISVADSSGKSAEPQSAGTSRSSRLIKS